MASESGGESVRATYRQQSLTARRHDQYNRLITAARHRFAEHGYVDSSIQSIVADARVSRTTFYEFFADKEDCLLAVFREAASAGEAALGQIAPLDLPLDEKVRAGVSALLRAMSAEPDLGRVALSGVVGATPAIEQARHEARQRFAEIVAAELRELDGWRDRPESELQLVAVATMAGLGEAVTYLLATDEIRHWRRLVEPLTAYAVRALSPPPESSHALASVDTNWRKDVP